VVGTEVSMNSEGSNSLSTTKKKKKKKKRMRLGYKASFTIEVFIASGTMESCNDTLM
jgi:hypothetical protein